MFNFFKKTVKAIAPKPKADPNRPTVTFDYYKMQKRHVERVEAGISSVWRHRGNGDLYVRTYNTPPEYRYSTWELCDSETQVVKLNTDLAFKFTVLPSPHRRSEYEAMV